MKLAAQIALFWWMVGACAPAALRAAIPLGAMQTFETRPVNTSWSTTTVPGGSSSLNTVVELETAVQAIDAGQVSGSLTQTAATQPGTSAPAIWSSTSQFIGTRSGGVAATILMATIENTSGADLFSATVRYKFSISTALVSTPEDGPLAGHWVYYSLTGLPGSWTVVPELVTGMIPPSDGTACANLHFSFIPWLAGSQLYLLWVDDNGFTSPDTLLTIDDFLITPPIADVCQPLVITPQPQNVTNLAGRTVSLQSPAVGLNLAYQWFKVQSGPIDPARNPTATRATLVITYPRLADSGDYYVVISSPAGNVTSRTAHVEILHDDIPPRLLGVRLVENGPAGFALRLDFDEPVCADFAACGGDATDPFNWIVEDIGQPQAEPIPLDFGFMVGETQVVLPVQLSGRTPRPYRLRYAGFGLTDKNGLSLAAGTEAVLPATLFVRPGADTYRGVEDTELESGTEAGGPNLPHGSLPSILVDSLNGSGPSHGLLQFRDLIGFSPTQVPPGATILRATLRLHCPAFDDIGTPVLLTRMLKSWSEATATWNGFDNGITMGIDAEASGDALIQSFGRFPPVDVETDVTVSVAAWSGGVPNHGWALLPTGSDSFRFVSSETNRGPALVVEYRNDLGSCQPAFLNDAPASIPVPEGGSVVLAPQFSSFPLLAFQWTRNGSELPGATNSTLTVDSEMICGGPADFRLRMTCPNGGASATSSPVTIFLQADLVRPVLVSAIGDFSGTQVFLEFSRAMNPATATNPASYSFAPELPVTSVALSSNGMEAILSTSARGLTPYTLRIQGVTSQRPCGNGYPLLPDPTIVELTGVQLVLPWDSEWLYATNSQDDTLAGAGAPWYSPAFMPDQRWKTGQALFGHETSLSTVARFPTALRTFIPPNTNSPANFITTYYRRALDLPSLPPGAGYVLGHFIDDGAVAYLDGIEITRFNMSNRSPVLSTDPAASALDATVGYLPFQASPGTRLLAVEVHQPGPTPNSDILFGAQVLAITAPPMLSISNGFPAVIRWNADSAWELAVATNVAGPYVPAPASVVPRSFFIDPVPAGQAFYQLRFRGGFR